MSSRASGTRATSCGDSCRGGKALQGVGEGALAGDVANRLDSEGASIIEIGTDQPSLGIGLDLVGKTGVDELAQLLSQVDLVIGNDSGPLHLALAVGTPRGRRVWCYRPHPASLQQSPAHHDRRGLVLPFLLDASGPGLPERDLPEAGASLHESGDGERSPGGLPSRPLRDQGGGGMSEAVSLFFPMYDEEANVERAVTSAVAVLEKVAPDFEVIVVNDGSRDRTAEIARALCERDSRIRTGRASVERGVRSGPQIGIRCVTLPSHLLHRWRQPVRCQRASASHRSIAGYRYRLRLPHRAARSLVPSPQRSAIQRACSAPLRRNGEGRQLCVQAVAKESSHRPRTEEHRSTHQR